MERTTQKQIDCKLDTLNRLLGRPTATYTLNAGGRYTANIGNLHIDSTITGLQVCEIINDGGAVTCPLGSTRHTKREMWEILNAACAAVQMAQQGFKLKEAA